VTEDAETIRVDQTQLNKAFDALVAGAEEECFKQE
jgi:hypothetical protein